MDLSRLNCSVSTCSPTTEGAMVTTESVEAHIKFSTEIREADSRVKELAGIDGMSVVIAGGRPSDLTSQCCQQSEGKVSY